MDCKVEIRSVQDDGEAICVKIEIKNYFLHNWQASLNSQITGS